MELHGCRHLHVMRRDLPNSLERTMLISDDLAGPSTKVYIMGFGAGYLGKGKPCPWPPSRNTSSFRKFRYSQVTVRVTASAGDYDPGPFTGCLWLVKISRAFLVPNRPKLPVTINGAFQNGMGWSGICTDNARFSGALGKGQFVRCYILVLRSRRLCMSQSQQCRLQRL